MPPFWILVEKGKFVQIQVKFLNDANRQIASWIGVEASYGAEISVVNNKAEQDQPKRSPQGLPTAAR